MAANSHIEPEFLPDMAYYSRIIVKPVSGT